MTAGVRQCDGGAIHAHCGNVTDRPPELPEGEDLLLFGPGQNQARLRVAPQRFGAASFAYRRLAWFTEPQLAEGQRRMVDQMTASWNRLAVWLRRLDAFRPALPRLPVNDGS